MAPTFRGVGQSLFAAYSHQALLYLLAVENEWIIDRNTNSLLACTSLGQSR